MKIIASQFVRRQTAASAFSHFDGTWDEVVRLTEASMANAVAGYRDGVMLVRIPDPTGFFTSTCRLVPGDSLSGEFRARAPGEKPRKSVRASARPKTPARRVDIVLYRADVLAESDEGTKFCTACRAGFEDHDCGLYQVLTDADWEIISANSSLEDYPEPQSVGTIMANHFHVPGSNDGGTSTHLTDQEFVARLRESHAYWADKALASPG